MPYVEGFGTWPFGEEWLWEAIATCYLPLLEVLGEPGSVPVTLSLTPVLCDQLERPDAIARCLQFLDEIRPESHRRDLVRFRADGEDGLATAIERSAAEYAAAGRALRRVEAEGGLLAALGRHVSWTSAATHPVLPLVATDDGVSLQLLTGIASHRRRFGEWDGGFWLPECAYAQWLDPLLEADGVRATCVELTAAFGRGDPRHLGPLRSDDGPVLWPIDRATIDLFWSDGGYPAAGAYRDHHRVTDHQHRPWANDGEPYDRDRALAQARADAAAFVAAVRERVAGGGVCVCAFDAELLGHWWYEGVEWLAAVIDEAGRRGLALTTLDDALERREPAPAPASLPVSSWGAGGDLRTWSGPAVAAFAWRIRAAELAVAAGAGGGLRPAPRVLRELLALQASDWAFLEDRGIAGDYPEERASGHLRALELALSDPAALEPELRGLAPDLARWGA